jgi:Domain of Unknown Function (DUF928)
MRWTNCVTRSIPWVGVLLGLWVCAPTIALAQFNPPSRGAPGRREGGGTRDGICTIGKPGTLIALIPATNIGLTTAEYPRFFWFQPRNRAQLAEFSLYQGDEKKPDRTLVYKTTFSTSEKAGIASIALPKSAGIPPLQLGKDYHWSVTLLCDTIDVAPKPKLQNITVNGWVQRVQPQPIDPRATPQARINLMGQRGLWFDVLEAQAEQRCLNPNGDTTDWTKLLQAVNLEKVATQPIVCWK